MESYEVLLDKALKELPAKKTSDIRFEPPVLISAVSGVKTYVSNFDVFCAYIRRDPRQVTKFFLKELAVPGALEGKRLALQGKFSSRAVSERAEAYVKLFVLCKECGKPDTQLQALERGLYSVKCEACGAKRSVRD